MINFSNQQTPLKEWGDYSPETRDKDLDLKHMKTIVHDSTKYVGKNSHKAKQRIRQLAKQAKLKGRNSRVNQSAMDMIKGGTNDNFVSLSIINSKSKEPAL